jgi:hypothetical protein
MKWTGRLTKLYITLMTVRGDGIGLVIHPEGYMLAACIRVLVTDDLLTPEELDTTEHYL